MKKTKKEGGCTICYIHCLCSELEIYFLKRKKKNQLVLNLFMDFCDQCESTQRGSLGPSSSQLMCLKGNYHWCCFSLPLRSESISELSRPGCPPRGTNFLPVLADTDKAPRPRRGRRGVAVDVMGGEEEAIRWVGRVESNKPNCLELIANPIKAGNTAYWFTPLNTDYRGILREYIMCKFTHKRLPPPQNAHMIYSSLLLFSLVCKVKTRRSSLALNSPQTLQC